MRISDWCSDVCASDLRFGKLFEDQVDDVLRMSFDHVGELDRRNPDRSRQSRHEAPSLDCDGVGSPASRTGFAKRIFDALGAATANEQLMSGMKIINDRRVEFGAAPATRACEAAPS